MTEKGERSETQQKRRRTRREERRNGGEKMSAGRIARNIFLSLMTLVLMAVAGVYIYGMVYFKDHFFMHTTINGVDASQMTVEDVESKIAAAIAEYRLAAQRPLPQIRLIIIMYPKERYRHLKTARSCMSGHCI